MKHFLLLFVKVGCALKVYTLREKAPLDSRGISASLQLVKLLACCIRGKSEDEQLHLNWSGISW